MGQSWKSTETEKDRRRDVVTQYWREGYRVELIAAALGSTASQIADDVRRLELSRRFGRRPNGLRGDTPPKFAWRDSEQVPVPRRPAYVNSFALQMVTNMTEGLVEENAENQLAFDAHDAAVAKDELWMSQARAVLGAAIDHLTRMQRVLESKEGREAGMKSESANPSLRIVR